MTWISNNTPHYERLNNCQKSHTLQLLRALLCFCGGRDDGHEGEGGGSCERYSDIVAARWNELDSLLHNGTCM